MEIQMFNVANYYTEKMIYVYDCLIYIHGKLNVI